MTKLLYNRAEDFPFREIVQPILSWYRRNKRDLPWRTDPTPYRVWVSEIMLQQTRVEAVKDYYVRFLSALPTVFALAECDEDKLLKLWEGLGYYSRVRNMQKTAKVLVEKYGGEFPRTEKELLSLPGIGEYTVGSVSSIAFGLPVPAVDGNVLRVASRLSSDGTDISDPKYKTRLKEILRKVYPQDKEGASDFTQSLMELGALVCKPQTAECGVCPLARLCSAHLSGRENDFPKMPEKKAKRVQNLYVFIIETPEGICIEKRENGVLKGLNGFITIEKTGRTAEEALQTIGAVSPVIVKNKKFTHIFTHIRWEMDCFFVRAKDAPEKKVSREELVRSVALPTAFKQCLELLQ